MKKILEIKPERIETIEIELLSELAKNERGDSNEQKMISLEFLWNFLFNRQTELKDKVLANKAANGIPDILKKVDNEIAYVYVKQLVDNLRENKQGYLTLKILGTYMRGFGVGGGTTTITTTANSTSEKSSLKLNEIKPDEPANEENGGMEVDQENNEKRTSPSDNKETV